MIFKTACFTGYREEKMPFPSSDRVKTELLKQQIRETVISLSPEIDTYICGMCHGADLWAAEAVLSLRSSLGIKLICAVPFKNHKDYIPKKSHSLYESILSAADSITVLCGNVSKKDAPRAFNERNLYMLRSSDILIAICPYSCALSGGTKNTVSMARSMSKSIHFIDPDTLSRYTEVNRI